MQYKDNIYKLDFDNVTKVFNVNDQRQRKTFESMSTIMEGYKACNYKTDTQFLNTNTKQIIHVRVHNKKEKKN